MKFLFRGRVGKKSDFAKCFCFLRRGIDFDLDRSLSLDLNLRVRHKSEEIVKIAISFIKIFDSRAIVHDFFLVVLSIATKVSWSFPDPSQEFEQFGGLKSMD